MRYPFDEFTTVLWVPGASAISDIRNPATGELEAGLDWTCELTKDGLAPGGQTDHTDDGALCRNLDGALIGSVGYDFLLKLRRNHSADSAWVVAEWGADGYLVVRRGWAYGVAFADGQKVEVYKGQLGEPVVNTSAANAQTTFELPVLVHAATGQATVHTGDRGGSLLTESGDHLTTEGGDRILLET